MKQNWCVLLYCCACLYHSLLVVQPSWTTVPCATTKLSLLISKSFVGIVLLWKHLYKARLESVFTKLHFRIGWMTILVLHQAVSLTFYNKIAPMGRSETVLRTVHRQEQFLKYFLKTFFENLLFSLQRYVFSLQRRDKERHLAPRENNHDGQSWGITQLPHGDRCFKGCWVFRTGKLI